MKKYTHFIEEIYSMEDFEAKGARACLIACSVLLAVIVVYNLFYVSL